MFDPWANMNNFQFYYLDANNDDYYAQASALGANLGRNPGMLGRGEDEEIAIARILWQIANSPGWNDANLFRSLARGVLPSSPIRRRTIQSPRLMPL